MSFIAGPYQITLGGALLAAGARSVGTIAVPGARVGMHVIVTPQSDIAPGACCGGYVSANDVVTIWLMGVILVTPPSTVFNVSVWS